MAPGSYGPSFNNIVKRNLPNKSKHNGRKTLNPNNWLVKYFKKLGDILGVAVVVVVVGLGFLTPILVFFVWLATSKYAAHPIKHPPQLGHFYVIIPVYCVFTLLWYTMVAVIMETNR